MFLNLAKASQKCALIVLAIVLCLIVIENFLNKLATNHTNTNRNQPIIREPSIVVLEQQSVGELAVDAVNNGDSIGTPSATDDSQMTEANAILLWWTPFIGEMEYTKNCGNSVCFFTGNHKYFGHEKLKTLLFYGSNINKTDMPLPREQHHVWALLHEESPKNVPSLLYVPMLSLFDVTATFSQQSDMPLTLQYLESVEKLLDRKFFVKVEEKNRLQTAENLAPILFIQSICDTLSGRDQYVAELMKFIPIDSYGKCLNNNKNMPKTLTGDDYLSTLDTDEFSKFIARYKFVIAYENSVCTDYITEKLWRPLSLGVVPIYFGAPNVDHYLPNNRSIIRIAEFENPKKLVDHLRLLNNNDAKYNQLLDHKIKQKVENDELLKQLKHRKYETNSIVEDFECFVCQRSVDGATTVGDANKNPESDMCSSEPVYPKMRSKIDSQRANVLKQGKCEAEVLHEMIMNNRPFTLKQFQNELIGRYNGGICKI